MANDHATTPPERPDTEAADHDAAQIPDLAVRKAFEELRGRHGPELDERLQDPAFAERFLTDPVEAMRSLGWEVPAEIARLGGRLRSHRPLQGPSYLLTNGQVMRPRIHLRFRGPTKAGTADARPEGTA